MNILVWIIRLVIVLLLVWFAAKNAEVVTLHGIGGMIQAPLALILLAFFGAGLLLGLVSGLMVIFKQRREIRKLNRALQQKARNEAVLPPASPTAALSTSQVITNAPSYTASNAIATKVVD
jgi:lipopolysaccharide assembly protein A